MTRLQQCIDALRLIPPQGGDENSVIEEAIAIITRILSAEPTSEEIERAAKAIINTPHKRHVQAAITQAKAALLTAFSQQEKL